MPDISPFSYNSLVTSVTKEMKTGLISAQKALEYQRLKTYWNVGKIINAYLAKTPEAVKRGNAFFQQVAEDLNHVTDLRIAHDTLTRMVQFQRAYPTFPVKTTLTFSHYLTLMRVCDLKARARLEARAIKSSMSVTDMKREVALMTRASVPMPPSRVLAVERGEPFIYALKSETDVSGKKIIRIDCGFKILKSIPHMGERALEGGSIIRSTKSGGKYSFYQSQKLRTKRYTYPIIVTGVVDGDTFDACVDVGFGIWINDRFRLRGINTPELGTTRGQAAKAFCEKFFEVCPRLIIRSTREGMYGRWLADVFALEGEEDPLRIAKEGEYFNQLLLDEGLAEVY